MKNKKYEDIIINGITIKRDPKLEELHEAEVEILKEFLKIIKKLKLRYFLLGGSVVGTVLYSGFIPWDDDIDVGMPRNDYETFLKEAPKYLPNHLFVQTIHTEKNHPWHFSKIRNSNTTFIEDSIRDLDINHGIYIDIFPLDGIGNSKEKVFDIHKKYRVMNEIHIHKRLGHDNDRLLRKIYYSLLSLPYTISKIENKIQKYCQTYSFDKSEYVCNFFGNWGEKEIYKREWFGNGKIRTFESVKVVVPEDTNKYLKSMYGPDAPSVPPEEKRHYHSREFDLNISYKDYLRKK